MLAKICSVPLALFVSTPVAPAQACTLVHPFAEATELHSMGDDTLLFRADEGLGLGLELYRWRADTGVTLVKDIWAGPGSGYPVSFGTAWLGGELVTLFAGRTEAEGTALWRTDGTTAGTYMVKDPYPGLTTGGIQPIVYHPGLQRAFFRVWGPGSNMLWSSDGTPGGTHMVEAFAFADLSLHPIGDHLYYARTGATGDEIARTDGSPGSAELVAALPGKIDRMMRVGENLAAEVTTTTTFPGFSIKTELYRIDTQAGTAAVVPFFPTVASENVELIAVSDLTGELYLLGWHGGSDHGIYRSDLTASGTVQFATIPITLDYHIAAYDKTGGSHRILIPTYDDTTSTKHLQILDTLTPAAPQDLPMPMSSGGTRAAFAGGGVYFLSAGDASSGGGSGLYVTLGTASATGLVCPQPAPAPYTGWTDMELCAGYLFYGGVDASGQSGLIRYEVPGASTKDLGFYPASPRLRATDPFLGGAMTIQGDGSHPGDIGLLLYSAPPAAPLDLGTGTPGWIDLATSAVWPGLLSPSWSRVAFLPTAPSLAGAELNLQGWFLNPVSGQLTTTNALRLHLEH